MVRIGLLILVATLVAGCKYMPKLDEVLPDKRSEYKKSQTLPDLEVPPDLSTESINDKLAVPDPEGASFSTYQERIAARKKAREEEGLTENAIETLSGERALAVTGTSAEIWRKLHDFWSEKGFSLDLDDAEYGVQETRWREDRDNLVRDKYKIFAEPGEKSGTTTLYISHEGEELRPQGEGLEWQKRSGSGARDSLVAELEAYLGGTTRSVAAAVSPASGSAMTSPAPEGSKYVTEGSDGEMAAPVAPSAVAEIVDSGSGKYYIAYPVEFGEAWARTGEALERGGVKVNGADKAKGAYAITYEPVNDGKKSMLSKLAFWKGGKKDLQVSVTGVGTKSEIAVLDDDGDLDKSDAATQLLSLIRDQLNGSAR